jgi:adenylate cyclase
LKLSLILLALSTLIFVVAIVAIVLSITKPIQQIIAGMQNFSFENLELLRIRHSGNEIGKLSRSINQMIRGLIERNRIRDIFGRYVSREIREAILMNKVSMKGEKKDVTILFMDIRNFTDLSEKMRPEELIDFLNRYFSYMVDAIIKRGGVIDKFMAMRLWPSLELRLPTTTIR